MEHCEETLASRHFGIEDYLVFATTLLVSLGIGFFHGCCSGGRQRTVSEFLMGNRQMSFLTLGASLTVGFTSAIALLGNVAEMYNYGTQYALTVLAFIAMVPLSVMLFLPVFRELRVTSIYEYLELRFGNGTRLLVSGLYTLQTLMYVSVVVYAPALALRQVTGLETLQAVAIMFAVCILYSSLGGIKAVVWSDTFQAAVILAALIVVLVRGMMMQDGGMEHVWELASKSDRLEILNLDLDPRVRHTAFSVLIGTTFYWVSMNAATQTAVQRLLSAPSLRHAKWAMWLSCLGMTLIYGLTFYIGLMVYAHFHKCDPLLSKAVDATDQLLPLYVMDVAGSLPGIPGLFVAGVFSASLSTVASALNAMAASTLRDTLNGGLSYYPNESRAALISRLLCVLFGVLCFAFVLFVRHLGGVLQVALTFNGMMCGVALGVFTLGMYFPRASAKGTVIGVLVALGLVLWLALGAQLAVMKNDLVHPRKSLGTDCGCNVTISQIIPKNDEVFDGYRISYLWYSPLGWFLTVVIGAVASELVGRNDTSILDPGLVSPCIRCWLPKNTKDRCEDIEMECSIHL